MNWDALGAIAELIGAVAVVATLIYLVGQLRQNTQSIRASAYGTWIQGAASANAFADTTKDFLNDALQNSRPLDSSELWAFHQHMLQTFNTYESLYLMHIHRTIDDEFFQAKMNAVFKLLEMPGVADFWDEWQFGYDQRFVAYVSKPPRSQLM